MKACRFRIGLALLVFLSVASLASASESFPVDLETVLKLAGARNLTIEETRLQVEKALAQQAMADEWWLPSVETGFSTHYLNGAAMNSDGRIFTGVDRNNLWSGLGLHAEIDFNQGVFGALAARQRTEAAGYFSLAEKNQVLLRAVEAYFDLKTEQIKTSFLKALVDQAEILAGQLELQANAGLRYQSEALLAESNTGGLKIAWLEAQAGWRQQSARLANLLNLDDGIELISADDALVPLSRDAPAVAEGFAGRPEFKGLTVELEALETSRKTANEGLLLPKLSVGVQNGVFGAYQGPTRNTSEVNAALLWTIPLGRFTYQGDLKQWDNRISLQRNKVAQFKNRYLQETRSTQARLSTASEQISVGKKALKQSAEALNQAIEREKLGTAKPFEVFQSQQFYLEAQIDYLKAVADFNKAQFAFRVAQGEILVDD